MLVLACNGFLAGAGWVRAGEPAQSAERPLSTANQPNDQESSYALVEGQVTNAIGAGIEGAVITVRAKESADPNPVGTTTTNDLGDFVVRSSTSLRGTLVVSIEKANYSASVHEVAIEDVENPPYLSVELFGVLTIKGRVLDGRDDRPIAEAAVVLDMYFRSASEQTDAEGRFSFKQLSEGGATLTVTAKGFGRRNQQARIQAIPAAADADTTVVGSRPARLLLPKPRHRAIDQASDQPDNGDELIIRLFPDRVVTFSTVDEAGTQVSGVLIECQDETYFEFESLVSDESGSATLRGIPFDAKRLHVRCTHGDYVSSTQFDRAVELPAENPESSHPLVLIRAATISGIVLDARTGVGLHGVRVMTGSTYSDSSPRDWSDPDGKFTILGVLAGQTVVTAHKSGFAPELKTLDLNAGAVTKVEFTMHEGVHLVGFAKNSDGSPAVGFPISTGKWRSFETLGLRSITDKEGKFTIDDVPQDEFEIMIGPITKMVKRSDGPLTFTLPERTPDAPTQTSQLRPGSDAPDISLIALDGSEFRTILRNKKLILLDFWATWCGPCVVEVPALLKIHQEFGNQKDFALIGISLDFEQGDLQKFIDARKITWPQIFGESARSAAEKFGVTGIPATFLVNAEGKIVAVDLMGDDLQAKIRELLRTPPKSP